jgi:hypothetical protein
VLISIRNVCNFIILSTPSNLEKKEILKINQTHPFTHYMICTLNRLRIKPDSIKENNNITNFTILEQINEYEWKEHNFTFLAMFNDEKVTLKSDGKIVSLTLESGKKEIFENLFTFLGMISYNNPEIHKYIEQFLYLDVQYIGQTEMRHGQYLRFKGHEKINKVSNEIIENKPNKEVIIKLMSFQKPFTSAMTHPDILSDDSRRDWLPDGGLIENMPNSDWKTLIEGTLIKYFNPKYNVHYKDNFPSERHSSYGYFFDKNIRSVSVETHEEYMAHKTGNDNVPYTRIRLIEYLLKNDEDGAFLHDNNKQDMDELINIYNKTQSVTPL